MTESDWALTEKEKQTLRLIVRGHDAKSIARRLGLSVHTINERLREVRRKMAVSSSREAARMLLQLEGDGVGSSDPDLLVDTRIGEDLTRPVADQEPAPIIGVGRADRPSWIVVGGFVMTVALGFLALTALPHIASPPSPPSPAALTVDETAIPAVVDAARRFLTLVDQGRWAESYQETGAAFRKLNTAQTWARVSEKVRLPLGAVISRSFVSQQNLPAPPAGYEVVKFVTHFANKEDALETVSLVREDDGWRVVGITIG